MTSLSAGACASEGEVSKTGRHPRPSRWHILESSPPVQPTRARPGSAPCPSGNNTFARFRNTITFPFRERFGVGLRCDTALPSSKPSFPARSAAASSSNPTWATSGCVKQASRGWTRWVHHDERSFRKCSRWPRRPASTPCGPASGCRWHPQYSTNAARPHRPAYRAPASCR